MWPVSCDDDVICPIDREDYRGPFADRPCDLPALECCSDDTLSLLVCGQSKGLWLTRTLVLNPFADIF